MHAIDVLFNEDYLRTAPERLRVVLGFAREYYMKLGSLRNNGCDWASRLAVSEPTSPNVLLGLKIAARATTGMMVGAMRPGEPITWWLGEGEPAHWVGPGINNLADIGYWFNGFHLATICRDVEALEWLVETPVELVRAAPGVSADEYNFLQMEAYQAFQRGSRETVPKFLAALRATAPEKIEIGDVEWVLNVDVPEMEVFHHILAGDAKGLNEALEKGLVLHEKYWDADVDDRNRDPTGFIARALLAMAWIAHDRGMAITVESDYLPAWLIRGEWAQP